MQPAPAARQRLVHDERLRVPWTWWLLGAIGLGLLVDEFDTTLIIGQIWIGWRIVGIAFFALLFLTWMLSMSSTRVAVSGLELLACGDRLPLTSIGDTRPVDDTQRRRLMGPHGNRLAHLATRPWVKTGLLIQNVDPADPAPYWLVSTRHPEKLAAAIVTARAGAEQPVAGPPPAQRVPVNEAADPPTG